MSSNMKGISVVLLLVVFSLDAITAANERSTDPIYFPEEFITLRPHRIDPVSRTQSFPENKLPNSHNNKNNNNNKSYDSAIISFAWKLFQGSKLPNPVNNLVLSPLILQFLLGILEHAAEGETKAQLRQVIGIEDARRLQPLFTSPARTIQLESASGIFLDAGQVLNPKFVDYVKSLRTEITSVDFKNRPVDSKDYINKWASDATHGTINELISPAYDVQQVQVVVASAIYFHSAWKYKFNRTEPEIFYTYVGNGNYAEFMEVKQHLVVDHIDLGYGVDGDIIDIPYEGDDYSMLIIVPRENVTLDEFIRKLDISSLEEIIKSERLPRPVTLRMPKFKIKSHFSVVNSLLKMGLVDLFTLNSRLPYMVLNGDSRITDIIQEATLTVDEEGTIASAATSSFLIPLSAAPRKDFIFTVNKPFLSIIVDKKNQIPLFISKIYQPTY